MFHFLIALPQFGRRLFSFQLPRTERLMACGIDKLIITDTATNVGDLLQINYKSSSPAAMPC
jgi:hypothetical protein